MNCYASIARRPIDWYRDLLFFPYNEYEVLSNLCLPVFPYKEDLSGPAFLSRWWRSALSPDPLLPANEMNNTFLFLLNPPLELLLLPNINLRGNHVQNRISPTNGDIADGQQLKNSHLLYSDQFHVFPPLLPDAKAIQNVPHHEFSNHQSYKSHHLSTGNDGNYD